MEFINWNTYGRKSLDQEPDFDNPLYHCIFRFPRLIAEKENLIREKFGGKIENYENSDGDLQERLLLRFYSSDKQEFDLWCKDVFNYVISLNTYL